MQINEDGLLFGNFEPSDCFHIENTKLYSKLKGRGFKSVEFVLHKPEERKLLFVEGKTTLPAADNIDKYDEEIAHISQKFMDSFQLSCGIWVGQYNSKVDLPANSAQFFMCGVQIVFVLVIKNRRGNLVRIAEKIKRKLSREHRLLQFEVLVLNEEDARTYQLVVSEEQA